MGLAARLLKYQMLHRPWPPPWKETTCCQKEYNANVSWCQYWNARSQTFTPGHTFTRWRLALRLNQYDVDCRGPLIVKIEQLHTPCYEAAVVWSQALYSTDLPAPGSTDWTVLDPAIVPLTGGTTYRITVHTTPGWQWWDGANWVPAEHLAGINWWKQDGTNPYPGGAAYHGCNYRDSAGGWTHDENDDFSFCIEERTAMPFTCSDLGSCVLNNLGDVNIPSPSDEDIIYWDAAAGKWKAKAPSASSKLVWKPTADGVLADTNRTATLDWTDLDLSSYTSAKTKAVIFRATIHTDSYTDGRVYMAFRKNGEVAGYYPELEHPNPGNHDVFLPGLIVCGVDSSQVMEYTLHISGTAQADFYIRLLGYIEEV